ncbi:sulfatase-like hydrolase/transferase [Polaribacter sp. Z014]|uniref:sulfatase-like hydrolase/transferase n=1 Tax=unclassified Polaribacter TaxID=196858 RepID=UPI00193BF5DC|nr:MULTISPECIES: sulfatase-like hydrolase/transferase [unclassified Polaribacter]MCL7762555.1 sulfatase-like hydrolase/transferase [Polaribacter sp. Z014]QVY66113.1 sulfatase-like hydrolase/transferase [Polaribacter sp. Q13]
MKNILTGIMILACTFNLIAQNKKNTKPNVLVIYTDDHRYSGIHALGGMPVKTPNIDKLAADGVVFTNTFLMGSFSGATCMPSRAMLQTGKQLFNLDGLGRNVPTTDTTMGEAFKKAGYKTHIVGKWHQDNESLNRSFDSGDKIMGRSAYLTDHYRMPFWDFDKKSNYTRKEAYLLQFDKNGKRFRRPLTKQDKSGPIGTEELAPHTSEVFAECASEYIKKNAKGDPFFMYLAFHAPHDPRQAPKKYLDMYDPKDIQLPPSYMAQHPFDNGDMTLRDEALAPWPRTPEVARKQLAAYYAIITHLDAQIGKVIQTLKESGAYENTIILLAGDSGLAVGNHGLIGKQNLYDEDGIHVPFIISGNLIKDKGRRIDALSYIHDIFPTVCDIAGIEKPTSIDGKSLLPVIKNKTTQVRNSTYHAYKQFQRAYRKGDYKLIEYVRAKAYHKKKGEFTAGSKVTQLFNIKKDIWETTDLSFQPEYNDILTQMRTEMKAKGQELGDVKVENVPGREFHFWDFY